MLLKPDKEHLYKFPESRAGTGSLQEFLYRTKFSGHEAILHETCQGKTTIMDKRL